LNCAKEGDLVFFGENKITHVGIIINRDEIIHAFGKIRIDKINKEGILNTETNKITHKLKKVVTFYY
jgi:cell wall-associated NlpC family hydrolase